MSRGVSNHAGGATLMRLHPTPLATPVGWPRERAGGSLGWLRDAIIPAPGIEPLLDRFEDPDLLVVTTGQQAGLFTGPLYTIHKALSAAALASRLSHAWQRPVRPLFWVAGDDHDFAEAASASWVTGDGSVEAVALEPRAVSAPMLPMYRETLGPEIVALRDRFLRGIPEAPHRERVEGWLTRHYRPEATIAGAYGTALAELLAPFGVVCLDSTHATFKRAAAPVLLRALAATDAIDAELAVLAERYAAEGETPPVVVGDGASLVFLEDRLGRDRLVRAGGGFATRRGGDAYSSAELTTIAEQDPQRLSASVLLRPVLESALLPTVAYVGGPGELRYLAMTGPVYTQLDTWRQAPIPRWSGVVVEPHVDRILAKFGATVEEVLADPGALQQRLLRGRMPAAVAGPLGELARLARDLHGRLEAPTLEIDPTLAGPLANARRQVDWAVRDLETRILRRLRAREATELGQVRRLAGVLRPGGHPQERVLTVGPFLAHHGDALLSAIETAAGEWYGRALEGSPPPA